MIPTRNTRTADVQIRGSTGPLWARLYWPPSTDAPPPLLVYFADDIRLLRSRTGMIVLATPTQYGLPDAKATVDWAADHASELEADPHRLLIAGTGPGAELAAEIHRIAVADGWPDLTLFDLNQETQS